MKPGTITHTIGVLLSSISSLFASATPSKGEPAKMKASKKSDKLADDLFRSVGFPSFLPEHSKSTRPEAGKRYPWKKSIVTTIFWIGEQPSENNPVPNRASSWDKNWTRNYGGFDDPNPSHRSNYIPVKFTPRQNPFYCALPYSDKANTDHWQYVFGDERPKPNLNKGAGLDVSPAVRDYLGLNETDVTDWKFVDFREVPRGPWSTHGENNTFVINERNKGEKLAEAPKAGGDGMLAR